MKIPIYQVDAFTATTFGGNPAAVCPLPEWIDEKLMQSIAAENNLAETAFFVPKNGGYEIRWFTPSTEVDLCGHATLASAFVIFEKVKPGLDRVDFASKSGPLHVSRRDGRIALDFPARPAKPCDAPNGLVRALGAMPAELLLAQSYLAVFPSEKDVRNLSPDFAGIAALDAFGVIVTAPGSDVDFVSRFFAPKQGIPEDPVTGGAHCTLVPYWSERLGKTKLRARQVSKRVGELWLEHAGDRVLIAGDAAPYLEGTIVV